MPAPAVVGVYVLAAVGTVAAGVAFKEFVYEPHIAPRVEKWAEDFLAKRRARKMRRAVPVPSTNGGGGGAENEAEVGDDRSTYELESLVDNEVRQWRSQIDVGRGAGQSLRHRKNVGSTSTMTTLDESNAHIPYDTMTPTHVLFDPTDGLTVSSPTSTSTMSSRVPTPSPHSTLSHSTFRVPPPPAATQAPPTPPRSPDPAPSLSTPSLQQAQDPFLSPHHVPSLSLSHPVDLDAEHDLELLSAPSSSRPSSPFSDFSVSQSGHEQFYSFASTETMTASPEIGVLSASGSEVGEDDWSNAGSEISGSSWASAGVQGSR